MSRRASITAGLLACFLLPAACFVEPVPEGEGGVLQLAVALPATPRVAAETAFNPWDGQGLFQLHLFPKYVRVAVEFADYELASASWPDPQRGAAGEADDGEVTVELKVPAGANRRLRLLAFAVPAEGPLAVFAERQALPLEVAAGQVAELSLEAVPHPSGAVDATVRCNQGNVSDWEPQQVSAVDARALVVHPPVPLTAGSSSALVARLPAIPVGRPHWVRILLRNRVSEERSFVDVRKPTFAVPAADQSTAINLAIPCGL